MADDETPIISPPALTNNVVTVTDENGVTTTYVYTPTGSMEVEGGDPPTMPTPTDGEGGAPAAPVDPRDV